MKKSVLFTSILLFAGSLIFAQEQSVESVGVEPAAISQTEVQTQVENSETVEVTVLENLEAEIQDAGEEEAAGEVVGAEEGETTEQQIAETLDSTVEENEEVAEVQESEKDELFEEEEALIAECTAAIEAAETAEEKLAAQLELQKIQRQITEARAERTEAAAAANRKEAKNDEIQRVKEEYIELAQEQQQYIAAKNGAEDKITNIEAMKESIYKMRQEIQATIDIYSAEKDADTNAKIAEIRDAEYRISETDADGNPTPEAIELRNKKISAISETAESEKNIKAKELKATINDADSKAMSQLKNAYGALESAVYNTNSFTDDLYVRIDPYDGVTKTWNLHVTSTLFGYTDLFEQDIPLSFVDVTGKKIKSIEKMSKREYTAYADTVELYDSIFRSGTDVFYVNLNYKIEKWSWASQYRFVPVKCELIKIGAKEKVLYKVPASELEKTTFTIYPAYEVRSDSDIQKELKKNSEKLAKEKAAKDKLAAAKASAESKNNLSTTNETITAMNSVSTGVAAKGRGLFIVTANTTFVEEEIKNFSIKNVGLDSLGAEFTFALGKHSFFGLNGSYLAPFGENENPGKMELGLEGGANWLPSRYFRPFVKGALDFDLDYDVIGKIGGGFDVIFASILDFTLGYDFNFTYNYGAKLDIKEIPADGKYHAFSHSIYAGLGLAW